MFLYIVFMKSADLPDTTQMPDGTIKPGPETIYSYGEYILKISQSVVAFHHLPLTDYKAKPSLKALEQDSGLNQRMDQQVSY